VTGRENADCVMSTGLYVVIAALRWSYRTVTVRSRELDELTGRYRSDTTLVGYREWPPVRCSAAR
jgi:hypothetical protein